MNWFKELFNPIIIGGNGFICINRRDGSGGFIIPETEKDLIKAMLESNDYERKDFPKRPFFNAAADRES
jgi:hypothetical protein